MNASIILVFTDVFADATGEVVENAVVSCDETRHPP